MYIVLVVASSVTSSKRRCDKLVASISWSIGYVEYSNLGAQMPDRERLRTRALWPAVSVICRVYKNLEQLDLGPTEHVDRLSVQLWLLISVVVKASH